MLGHTDCTSFERDTQFEDAKQNDTEDNLVYTYECKMRGQT